MAIIGVFDGEGITKAQYDQALKEVSPDNRPPEGMLYHAAAPTANGWRVVEVWESQAAADKFFNEKLRQALQNAKIEAQPPDFAPVHNIMKP